MDNMLIRAAQPLIDLALAEDVAAGDITTLTTVAPTAAAEGVFLAKAEGVLAGMPLAAHIMRLVDPRITVHALMPEGAKVSPGAKLATLNGPARGILTAERTALNFLQRMSGIATATARYVDAVRGTGAHIVDTRKTAPGHRVLDKYAVRMGGGGNHRIGLFDGVLIKDNHLVAAGGIGPAVAAARVAAPHTVKIEVECDTMAQVQEALDAGADIIMLDNMTLDEMRGCVALINRRALTEASGGVTLERVRAIAECGVDLISVGALTHSVTAMDISLDFVIG